MRIRTATFLLVSLVIGLSADADAMPRSSGREATGIVESIDTPSQMITVKLDSPHKGKDRLDVEWGYLTKGYLDGERTTIENLRPETPVVIRYITPVFGPPVLRRISWCDEKSNCNQ